MYNDGDGEIKTNIVVTTSSNLKKLKYSGKVQDMDSSGNIYQTSESKFISIKTEMREKIGFIKVYEDDFDIGSEYYLNFQKICLNHMNRENNEIDGNAFIIIYEGKTQVGMYKCIKALVKGNYIKKRGHAYFVNPHKVNRFPEKIERGGIQHLLLNEFKSGKK